MKKYVIAMDQGTTSSRCIVFNEHGEICGQTQKELEQSYPEFSNWKELPAWGFYIRHAENLVMKNVKISVKDADYRPGIVADDVNGLTLQGVQILQNDAPKGKKQIITNNVKKFKNKK